MGGPKDEIPIGIHRRVRAVGQILRCHKPWHMRIARRKLSPPGRPTLRRRCASGSGEEAVDVERLNEDGSCNLARVVHGARVNEGKCEVVVLRFMLQSYLISNDGADDLSIFVKKSAGSRDLVFGHDDGTAPVSSVSLHYVLNPQPPSHCF